MKKSKLTQTYIDEHKREMTRVFEPKAPIFEPIGVGVVSDDKRERLVAEFRARQTTSASKPASIVSEFLDRELTFGYLNPSRTCRKMYATPVKGPIDPDSIPF